MEFLNYEKKIDTTDISYILDGFKNGTIKDGDAITYYLHTGCPSQRFVYNTFRAPVLFVI